MSYSREEIITKVIRSGVYELSVRNVCIMFDFRIANFYNYFTSLYDLIEDILWYRKDELLIGEVKYLEALLYVHKTKVNNKKAL